MPFYSLHTHTHTLIHIRIKELELYPAANSSNPVKNTGIKKKKKKYKRTIRSWLMKQKQKWELSNYYYF